MQDLYSIYKQIEDVSETIGVLETKLKMNEAEKMNMTAEFNTKIKELLDICDRYAKEAYRFIGYLKDNINKVTPEAIDIYKSIIDSCITSESYKKELEHRYITKDIKEYYKAKIDKACEFAESEDAKFISRCLSDENYAEDDSENLILVKKYLVLDCNEPTFKGHVYPKEVLMDSITNNKLTHTQCKVLTKDDIEVGEVTKFAFEESKLYAYIKSDNKLCNLKLYGFGDLNENGVVEDYTLEGIYCDLEC